MQIFTPGIVTVLVALMMWKMVPSLLRRRVLFFILERDLDRMDRVTGRVDWSLDSAPPRLRAVSTVKV